MSSKTLIVSFLTVLLLSFQSDNHSIISSLSNHYTSYEKQISATKGKLLLIEFWASWCQPCRVQNDHLNHVQKEFSNKEFVTGNGLAICGISIDTDSIRWRKAIRNDDLQFNIQILDVLGYDSEFLKQQSVTYLPMNILVDSSGNVLGRGLYGKALEDALKQQLK